jgi:hypothetical protein
MSHRRAISTSDPRLRDRVADNLTKHEITESESLLFGTNFGVVTDVQTGPNGNLFVVSLSDGAIYEIFRPGASIRFATSLTGSKEVPAQPPRAVGGTAFRRNADGAHLSNQIFVANVLNLIAADLQPGPAATSLFEPAPAEIGRFTGVLDRDTSTMGDPTGADDSPGGEGRGHIRVLGHSRNDLVDAVFTSLSDDED